MNFILNLFSAGIQNRKITLPSDEELKNQMRIISEQTFLPYLYKVSNDSRFKKYYLSSFVLHEKYDEIAEKIADIFSANQIRYFFFKGYELFPLYDDRNLRLSGDIDFCVDGKDYLKARKLLEENSFVLDSIAKHHAEYVYDKSYAELHHQLLEEGEKGDKFFHNPFKYIKSCEGYRCHLEDEYHFVFLLMHYHKHLKSGAGVRELGDVYLMLTKKQMNYQKIISYVNELEISDFFNTIINELEYIFEYNPEQLIQCGMKYYKRDDIEELINYSLRSGIHGFGKENDVNKNKFAHSKDNKFVYLIKKVFIPLHLLFEKYPYSRSIILIPFAYIHHFISLLFTKRDKLNRVLSVESKDDDLIKFGIE